MAARKRSRTQAPDTDESNLVASLFGSHAIGHSSPDAPIGSQSQAEGGADFALDTEGSTFPDEGHSDDETAARAPVQAAGTSN